MCLFTGVIQVDVEIEVNRWRRGYYTLAQPVTSVEPFDASFELIMFFNTNYIQHRFDNECGGCLHNVSDSDPDVSV